jgi:hypothetical protein
MDQNIIMKDCANASTFREFPKRRNDTMREAKRQWLSRFDKQHRSTHRLIERNKFIELSCSVAEPVFVFSCDPTDFRILKDTEDKKLVSKQWTAQREKPKRGRAWVLSYGLRPRSGAIPPEWSGAP